MLHLTCTMISSVDLAHYVVSLLKIGYLRIVIKLGIRVGMEAQNVNTLVDRQHGDQFPLSAMKQSQLLQGRTKQKNNL